MAFIFLIFKSGNADGVCNLINNIIEILFYFDYYLTLKSTICSALFLSVLFCKTDLIFASMFETSPNEITVVEPSILFVFKITSSSVSETTTSCCLIAFSFFLLDVAVFVFCVVGVVVVVVVLLLDLLFPKKNQTTY